jgi:tRNA dimethylallyltransferase
MSENAPMINAEPPVPRNRPHAAGGGAPVAAVLAAVLAAVPADRPVLIAGPTASGKSALALALARAQGRQVVNADALQVYDRWPILTARPTPAEMAQAPHALYGTVAADADWSVGHWLRAVAAILAEDPRPVIVGGTGLYLSALTEGLAPVPPVPPEVRAEADARRARAGIGALRDALDPATAARIDLANPARVQRAWEVLRATGRGLAAWQADTPPPLLPLARAWPLVLRPGVAWLDARIAARFAAMMAAGALDEVRAELPRWNPAHPSARAIGAAELVAHLRGTLPLDAAVAAATLATRRYAKRQRTWFRNRMGAWRPLDPSA